MAARLAYVAKTHFKKIKKKKKGGKGEYINAVSNAV